jgi:hypothetical protein
MMGSIMNEPCSDKYEASAAVEMVPYLSYGT